MTESLIIQQAYKVEKLTLRCTRFRKAIEIVFDKKSRDRISWDLVKSKFELKIEQKTYIRLVDSMVSTSQLETFLKDQNLQITP